MKKRFLDVAMVGLLCLATIAPTTSDSPAGRRPAAKLVYLLEYVAADYGFAVRDGEIASSAEYEEMLRFARILVEGAGDLQRAGASADVEMELLTLLDLVLARAPVEDVRDHASGVAQRMLDRMDVVDWPRTAPDLERGRTFYAANCAACHGAAGGGDGPSSFGMEPPATSFRDPRMNFVSPHQVFGATSFGIEGTAMPDFGWIVAADELWDVSFFVMTLREDFEPRAPDSPLPVTLNDLARFSNHDLRGTIEGAGSGPIDHYRRHPRAAANPNRR